MKRKHFFVIILSLVISFSSMQIAKADDVTASRKNALTTAIKKASPAIVGINVTEMKQVVYRSPFDDMMIDPFFRQFFNSKPRVENYEVKGLGTGFVISKDGYILTNHHVAGNASKVVVSFTDGRQIEAKIIGSDATSDVALLKVEGEKDLPYLKLADSDDLIIGEWAIAFGNPFGLFDVNSKPTVTVGVISNSGVNFIHQENNITRVYRNMIQTDAAISSGNSGGPLLNANGEVIGMNTVIFSTAQGSRGAGSIGIGYSIPINRVKQIVDLIKEHKEIQRDFDTGINVKELDENLAKYLGIKKTRGVVVFSITRNSPGDAAGLEPGDIILEAEGVKIFREEDLLVVIKDGFTDQTIKMIVQRDDKNVEVSLKLKNLKRNK